MVSHVGAIMNAVAISSADEFIRINVQPLLRYLRKSVGAENAEDLVQEVFARFLQRSRVGFVTEEHATRWLFTVAKHLVTDYHRGNRRVGRFPDYDPDGDFYPDSHALLDERQGEFQNIQERMLEIAERMGRSGQYRILLDCLLEKGVQQEDIAFKLGVSSRTVRRMTAQLFHELQEGLKKFGITPDFFV